MKRIAGGFALAASFLALAVPARAGDGAVSDARTEQEKKLDAALAELDAQRMEIAGLKSRLAPAPAAQEGGGSGSGGGGIGDAVKQYLESEDGKKVLDKSLAEQGFVKTGLGTLKFGALLDFWYVQQRSDENAAGARTGVDTFRIRRAEIIMSGSIVKDLIEFAVMIDPARPLGNNEATAPTRNLMQDLKIIYKGPFGLPKDMMITVGQFKVPLGREGFSMSTSKLDFINRADGPGTLADARRPGAMIQGAPMNGAVEWFANVHNNNGQNSQDTVHDNKNVVGRLVLNPLKLGSADEAKKKQDKWGTLSFGGSYMRGQEPVVSETFKRVVGDMEWRKSKVFSDKDGVFFTSEWFRDDHDQALSLDARTHFYAAGYKVNDHWEAVARHDIFRGQAGTTDRVTDTFGINYFIKGHNAKIDLNYIRVRQQTAAAGRTLVAQIILQFQVAF